MKIIWTCFSIFLMIVVSCKSSQQKKKVSSCISDKIQVLKSQSIQNPPAEIWKWETEGKIFYYFNAPCCDQFSTLYDESCETICAPDGGFTGKGDGKCPDFDSNTKRTLIWKDDRKF